MFPRKGLLRGFLVALFLEVAIGGIAYLVYLILRH